MRKNILTTLAYESFEDNSFNKEHKGMKKGSHGMEFENYARRILLVIDCNFFEKWPVDTKQTARLLVTDVKMQQKAVTKTKSSQFNDKRFYFSNGTTSLPLSHSYLKDLNKYKEKKRSKDWKMLLARKR